MRLREGSLKRGSVWSFEKRGSVILYSSAGGLEVLPFGARCFCLGKGIVTAVWVVVVVARRGNVEGAGMETFFDGEDRDRDRAG